jgi:hypothetical protein
MSLPGFSAEATLYKTKAEYKSFHKYNYQNSKIIKPAHISFSCLRCLIACEIRCNPNLGGAYCFVPCSIQCNRECGFIQPSP